VLGVAGPVYFAVATLLGSGLLVFGVRLARTGTPAAARQLLLATLLYLPLLLGCMALDKVPL
jgi:heme O synthase-like polyprenyltransferase